jgi:GT2 family glycosyltransferase
VPTQCSITAILPAHERVEAVLKTLRIIHDCEPRPAEVIVHVDGGSEAVVMAVRQAFPKVRVLTSQHLLGPGGGRNRLIAAASYELVANFDDDSFPEFPDYFARVLLLAERFPSAAMYSAASMASEREIECCQVIGVASGCGCVFRRGWFARTRGFVPLVVAYGMEEVDMSLQLYAQGGLVVHDPALRVVHDKELPKTMSASMNAATLGNTALLAYLRYPVWLWPLGAMQLVRRVLWLLRQRWLQGLVSGLLGIPAYVARYREYRAPLSASAVLGWMRLKREGICTGWVERQTAGSTSP